MDKTMAEAFASLNYINRLPSWQEYIEASPAAKRAILARWMDIASKSPLTRDDFMEWCKAIGRASKAAAKMKEIVEKQVTPWWYEDYIQGDDEQSGIGNKTQAELGE